MQKSNGTAFKRSSVDKITQIVNNTETSQVIERNGEYIPLPPSGHLVIEIGDIVVYNRYLIDVKEI